MMSMRKTMVTGMVLGVFTLALAACGGGKDQPEDGARGKAGKADTFWGSCAVDDSCGGISNGDCYCDSECSHFGDCCLDAAETCGVDECDPGTDNCPEGTTCAPGVCLTHCQPQDPGCCEPSNCVEKEQGECQTSEDCPELNCPFGGGVIGDCVAGKCEFPPVTTCPDVECGSTEDCPELHCPFGGGMVGDCVEFKCEFPPVTVCPDVECGSVEDCPELNCPFGGGIVGDCVDFQCETPPVTDCPDVECATSDDCPATLQCVEFKCL